MAKPEWISNLSQEKELQEMSENLILKNIENNEIKFDDLKKTIKYIGKEVKGALGKKKDNLCIVEGENQIFIGYDYGVGDEEGFVFINNGGDNSFILTTKRNNYRNDPDIEHPLQSVYITDITEEKIYEIFHILVKHRMYGSSIILYRFYNPENKSYAISQTFGYWAQTIWEFFLLLLIILLFYGAINGFD
ncbi:MAG: hypothetical protein HN812_05245 [Candidatus Marinimicrobia bacterium]|jgi:hypothetical protein|nr:hypothetical protein [Candidatus Neomarinimicrobiota bacterium]